MKTVGRRSLPPSVFRGTARERGTAHSEFPRPDPYSPIPISASHRRSGHARLAERYLGKQSGQLLPSGLEPTVAPRFLITVTTNREEFGSRAEDSARCFDAA